MSSFFDGYVGYLMYQRHYKVPLSYDLTIFKILGQKCVKLFHCFLENIRHQKDVLKLTDL